MVYTICSSFYKHNSKAIKRFIEDRSRSNQLKYQGNAVSYSDLFDITGLLVDASMYMQIFHQIRQKLWDAFKSAYENGLRIISFHEDNQELALVELAEMTYTDSQNDVIEVTSKLGVISDESEVKSVKSMRIVYGKIILACLWLS
jgi:hypothetical protein